MAVQCTEFDRRRRTLLGGEAVPPDGFRGVLRHASTVGVHEPEVVLGAGVTLLGGEAVPPDGFRGVLRHASTVGVHEPEVGLGAGVTLLGGEACRFVILGTGWRDREQDNGGRAGQYQAHHSNGRIILWRAEAWLRVAVYS